MSLPFSVLRSELLLVLVISLLAGCISRKAPTVGPQATAYGEAILVSSGDRQIGAAGSGLRSPLVLLVKDSGGKGLAGAAASMEAAPGVRFTPASGLTDSKGQFKTKVTLGRLAGRYRLTAVTRDRRGRRIEVASEQIALDYQQLVGRQLNQQYCERCHNPESTPERASNYENLVTKPRPFTDGDALNRLTDADLNAMISRGGRALGRSPEMPPWGYTLSKSDIQAVIAYIRAVSDPPQPTPAQGSQAARR